MTQSQTTAIPYNGSGTINIHINNPSATWMGGMPAYNPAVMSQYPYGQPFPSYIYPPNYYMNGINGGINQTTHVTTPYMAYPQQPLNTGNLGNKQNNADNNANNNKNTTSTNEVSKSIEKTTNKQREIVILTDNYIKNLENYLKSNNTELRKDATKELLLRFKEDKSRINNPSLTALLNIALQDTNGTVKSLAMTIIQAGYAKGDKLTEKLLGTMQGYKTNYSTDATQAANGLLEMSKTKVKVQDNSFYPDTSTTKKKGN